MRESLPVGETGGNARIEVADSSVLAQIIDLWTELMEFHQEFEPHYRVKGDAQLEFQAYLYESMESDESMVLVAMDGEETVGYSISRIAEHPPVFEIETFGLIVEIYVKEEYRRRGLASSMLDEIVRRFDSRGIGRLELHIAAGNEAALAFWESQGFRVYESVLSRDL